MTNLKKLMEKRAELHAKLTAIPTAADTENRAMTEEETAQFDALEKEIKDIDATIDREDRALKLQSMEPAGTETRSREAAEELAFVNYVLGKSEEMRAGEQNVDWNNNNGAIVPVSIANRIIKEVKDRCPILAGATMYSVKGTLKVPVWGGAGTNGAHNIAVGYQTEFTDITADAGKFTSVDLGGYLAGALTLIGRSVENNAQFSVLNFIVTQMAEEIATWIEGQLLNGTGTNAATGALTCANGMTAAAAAAVTADELIELQAKVKQAYQANACWTMHPDTFTAIKKLKGQDLHYLLQDDFSQDFPYRLLGKPVYLSDNMPTMAAGKKAILYGDYSGLSVNFRENVSVEVLRELYATKHVLGVVSWFEFDSKITEPQKLAVLTMKAS